jgi:hypothetical protein
MRGRMNAADAGTSPTMTIRTDRRTRTLTTSLGVASLTLGVSELLAPRGVARLSGIEPTERSQRGIRLLGLRECGHGAAILLGSPRLVWTRVAGDALDVALLVKALTASGADRRRGAVALGALAVIGALDVWAAKQELRPSS